MLVAPRVAGGEGHHPGYQVHDPLDSAQEATAWLARTSRRQPLTLVALCGAPNEQVLAAFDASDRVLLLCDPSVASIRGTQRTLKLCGSLGYGIEKTAVVLHDFPDDGPLSPADAAAALRREILWAIPARAAGQAAREAAFAALAARLIAPA
ncbi:MAG: hypothetical protein ABIZ91_08250 [Gemmatimonadaceae bacterium]